MLKKLQKLSLGLISSMLFGSLSHALECPNAQAFKNDVVQLPPIAFHPQSNAVHYYALASTFNLDSEYQNTENNWIMVLDIKASPDQLTENYASTLVQNMNRHQEQAQEFIMDSKHQLQYCLYHSNDNPKIGAIAYRIPQGFNISNKAHLQNFIRSITLK